MRLIDPAAYPGDNPLAPAGPPLPALATIAISVPYAPNPDTAALFITENGMNDGPYKAAVTGPAADGITYELTINLTTIPVGLSPGPVEVQAGDIAGGVFVPATVNGAAVPPDIGTLTVAGASFQDPNIFQDLDITLGAPVGDIAGQSGILWASSDEFLHMLVQATRSQDGTEVDVSAAASVEVAVVRTAPQAADWQGAAFLVRTVAPAGTYIRLPVGFGDFSLLPGCYWVYVRMTLGTQMFVRRALSTVRVRS